VNFDPRVTLVRDGLADDRLEGVIPAMRYAPGQPSQVTIPCAAVRPGPDSRAEQVDQVLFGEGFDGLETRDGFVFGQASRDGYVGWVAQEALSEEIASPTHWVSALRAYAFETPSIKAPARGPLSLNALVTAVDETAAMILADRIGWIARAHLSPVGTVRSDPAAVALAHLGAPYLWGGRESVGVDCSGLIQQALLACGLACPRDSDQQQTLGAPAPPQALARGDLVFWAGHVGMMLDGRRLVHANAHNMAVTVEPLARTRTRIAASGGGEPIAYRRLSVQTPGTRPRKP
jgi:cell wall-associated NlpC family hydrolase